MNHPLIKQAVLNSIEMGLANPNQQYRSLLGHLLALSQQYAHSKGSKERGPLREQAASIIDSLRRCFMPFTPPSGGDPRAASAYWKMIRSARPRMTMEPPAKKDRAGWDRERRHHLTRSVPTKTAAVARYAAATKVAQKTRGDLGMCGGGGWHNSPTLAYMTVYGKEPPEWLAGRSAHPQKMWQGFPVDAKLKDAWLTALNSIPGVFGRASCAGHGPNRVSYFTFRLQPGNDGKVGEMVAALSRRPGVFARAEVGAEGRPRICVAGYTWEGQDDWADWWAQLPAAIRTSLGEVQLPSQENG